ncbi:MAG: tetratricopeptide repeat protein [Planctomycetota bacterium]|nr:MAG: tetratricopeptide repeat protein [Planctomycetota bacterium]
MKHGRTVNVKFLSGLLASLMVLGLAVYSVHAIQTHRNAGVFLHYAERAEEEHRYDEAARYYRLYLGYAPHNNQARIALARMLEMKAASYSDYHKIFDLYERVLRQEPDDKELRRRLVEIAIALRRYNDASDHLLLLLRGPYRDDGQLEQLYAFCLTRKNEPNRAIGYYHQATDHSPGHLPSYVQLANLYLDQQKPAEADRIMKKMVDKNPNNYQAHLERAGYLRQRSQEKEMAKEIADAYRLAGDKRETMLGMAELARSRGNFDEARAYLKKCLQKFPKDAAIYVALAEIEMSARRPDDAIARLRTGLKEVPPASRNALRYRLALYLIQQGEKARDQVDEVVKQLLENHAPEPVLHELHARTLMGNRQWAEAALLLEKMMALSGSTMNGGAEVYFLLGQCYENHNEPDRALNAYRQAVTVDPGMTRARAGAAGALLALGRPDDALAEYQSILHRDASVGTKVAQLLIMQNLRQDKDKRHWTDVEEALEAAAKADQASVEVTQVKAQMLLARDKPDQALVLLEKACRAQPNRVDLWLAWSQMANQAKNPGKAQEILKEAQEQHLGDRIELRLARAWQWLENRPRDNKNALAPLEEQTSQFSAQDQAALFRGLGDVYYRAGDTRQAKRLWTKAAEALPQDVDIRMALFDLAVRENDQETLERLLAEIKRLDVEGILSNYAKANSLIAQARKGDRAKIAEAKLLLTEVANRRRFWAAPLRNLAALDELEGNTQQALEKYSQCIDLGDRNPYALQRMIQLLWDRQRYTELEQVLHKMQDRGNLPAEFQSIHALARSMKGDHQAAIVTARKVVEGGSKAPRDHVWLAVTLFAAGPANYPEAERVLRDAIKLPDAEKTPEPWVALVQVLAASNQKDKVQAVIDEAAAKLPPQTRTLTLAQCYEAIAQYDKAAAQFETALKRNPLDLDALQNISSFWLRRGRLDKAVPHLQQILDSKTNAPEDYIAWARRGLALQLASTSDYQQLQVARKLLEENLRRNNTLEDQRMLAVVLAGHPETRRQALRVLENLPAGAPNPEQRRIEARLYEAVRDWARARDAYNALAATALYGPEPNLSYVLECIHALLRHGNVVEAGAWMDKMQKLSPDALETLEAAVRVKKAQERAEEAADLLKRYLQTPAADLDLAAKLYEHIGKPAEAEPLYWRQVKQNPTPQKRLALARFLARQGHMDEGLSLCERVARDGELVLAATSAMEIIRAARAPAEPQVRRTEQLLTQARKQNPDAPAPVLLLAELCEQQQKFAAAEALYRQVLERSPNDPATANNLAWLLAFQSGKSDEALQWIERALQQAGKIPELLDTRAVILLRRGDAKQALQDLELALREDESALLYYHRAEAQAPGSPSAARNSLARARELKFTRRSLHPLERKSYDEFLQNLGEK